MVALCNQWKGRPRIATATKAPRTTRHPFWDFSPPFPDADGHRRLRAEADRQLGDERWTITPLAESLDAPEDLAFAPEIATAVEKLRAKWPNGRPALLRKKPGRHRAPAPEGQQPDSAPTRDRLALKKFLALPLFAYGYSQRSIASELGISRHIVGYVCHGLAEAEGGEA